MDLFNMKYSGKNIPLPSNREYLKQLLEKTESLIKRMRWKAFFFLNKDKDADSELSDSDSNESDDDRTETYGLKSKRTPPQIPEMIAFESEMLQMV